MSPSTCRSTREVDVLTTCARDYVTWRDDYPPGPRWSTAFRVRRFRVDHERDPHVFGRWSDRVFNHPHSYLDELKWLERRGAEEHVAAAGICVLPNAGYDYVLFFSYRYYHAYHGAKALPSRAILVPDGGARRSDRPRAVAADLPRRARAHVQQP